MSAPSSYADLADVVVNIGRIVHEARRSRRLSIRAAAKQIGINFSTLGRIEAGSTEGFVTTSLLLILRWLESVGPEVSLSER